MAPSGNIEVKRPMKVVIVGGSLAGLMQGIVLKRLGHHVRILERHNEHVLRNQGAGIMAMDHLQEFLSQHQLTKTSPYISSTYMQFLNLEGNVVKTQARPLKVASWDLLYYLLRFGFDGLRSSYCADVESDVQGVGSASYDYGQTVTNLRRTAGGVMVEHVNRDGVQESTEADLVIGADGASSYVQHLLLPEVQRTYAGYVAWRGTVPEKMASEEAKETFKELLSFFQAPGTQIVMYMIPGKDGSLIPGQRHLNWVWYCNYDAASPDFSDLMTDAQGRKHRFTVPASKIQPRLWTRQKAHAESLLPTAFSEIISKTSEPFVQIITDVMAPRMCLLDSKVLLVGDAVAGFRPHIGSSTAQAALHAQLLEKWAKGEVGLEEVEEKALAYARHRSQVSIEMGDKSQFGHLVQHVSSDRSAL